MVLCLQTQSKHSWRPLWEYSHHPFIFLDRPGEEGLMNNFPICWSLMHIPVQGPATQLSSFYKIRSLEESFCLWPFASVIHLPKMQFGFCLSHLLIKYLLSEFMGDCFFSGSGLEEREAKAVTCIRPPRAPGVPKAILILHILTNDAHLQLPDHLFGFSDFGSENVPTIRTCWGLSCAPDWHLSLGKDRIHR